MGKLYRLFTANVRQLRGKEQAMGLFAIALFVALFGFGQHYLGWSDPGGKVQLALISSFVLGLMAGFKNR